ncbi:MAG: Rieske (2Fe-2S) protein [Minicystis sp.]
MNERRRFLQVLGSTVVAASAGCGGNGGQGTGGNGGAGGATGTGGDGTGGATSSSTASSTASSTSSTTSSTSSTSSSTGGACAPTGVNVGMPDKFASDGLHKVTGTKVLIGRDAGGLFARSALCTHQSCNLNTYGTLISTGIHCGCHGAEYDTTGNVTKPPATTALKSYKLTLECDGSLYVDTTTVVPATDRLMA